MNQLKLTARIAKSFIENKALSWLLLIIITVVGIAGYFITPKSYNPQLDIANFSILMQYPGATAEEVENFVTKELEQVIADIDGVDDISAISYDGGLAVVNVAFKIGQDPENAKIKLLSKINSFGDLVRQNGLSTPVIKSINTDNVTIAAFGFYSETLSQNQMRELVIDIRDCLREVSNVANLEVFGGQNRALRILLDPDKMKLRRVSVTNVLNAIRASNIKVPAGEIKNGQYLYEIEVLGTFHNASEASKILVRPGIQLGDVSQIHDDYAEANSLVGLYQSEQFYEAVFLSLGKVRGSNITNVVSDVKVALTQEMQKEKYANLHYDIYIDEGDVAAESTNNLFINLLQSIIIVFFVLLLFLEARPALNVAITVPIILSITIFIGYLAGETINKVSLFAFILSLGILVDATIVVVENSYRHIQKGTPKNKAIVNAINETGTALIFSTLMVVTGFLTLINLSGILGEYVRPMIFFMPIILIVSLIVAITIIPFLASVILPSKLISNPKNKRMLFLKFLTDKYRCVLAFLLEKTSRQIKFVVVVFLAFIFSISCVVFDFVKQRGFPDADLRQFYVYIDAPDGTDIQATRDITETVVALISQNSNVRSQQIYIATPPIIDISGMARGAALRFKAHQATIRVNLVVSDNRFETSSEIATAVHRMLMGNKSIQTYLTNDTKIKILEDPPGPPYEASLLLRIKGPDSLIRQQVAHDVQKILYTTEGVASIDTTMEDPFRRILYRVDHDKALQSGVSAAAIAETLRVALGQQQVGLYHIKGQSTPATIELQFDKKNRDEVVDLEKIYLSSPIGEMIPLDSIIQKIDTRNEPVRYRDNRQSVTKLTAQTNNRSIVYIARDVNKILSSQYKFPDKGVLVDKDFYGYDFQLPNGSIYRIEWGGEWEQTLDSNIELGIAMIVAFLVIYFLLVLKFGSFMMPFIVMSTIPLGIIGIFPGFALLWLFGKIYISSGALIGLIALMGIAINNSLIFLEYFNVLQTRGLAVKEALIKTGQARLRPIMLTSLTTIFGTFTITSDPTWAGLAWSIVFGLSVSASIAIFLIPVLYNLTHKSEKIINN